jgi:hypothetical protein
MMGGDLGVEGFWLEYEENKFLLSFLVSFEIT